MAKEKVKKASKTRRRAASARKKLPTRVSRKRLTVEEGGQGDGTNEWTIMLYLAGDNNLCDEMVWALKEVYRIGTPEGVAVTLQFDPLAEGRSTRFAVAPKETDVVDLDGVFPLLHDDDLPELDCGDPGALVDFIHTSMTREPAKRYLLILSGHGSGVVGDFLTDTDAKNGLQPGSLTIPDLRTVFADLRSKLREEFSHEPKSPLIHVLGMDSCLMSMAEICSEIYGDVEYLIGSEGFDPATGWPYFRLLEDLSKRMKLPWPLEPWEIVRGIVDRYTTYYSDFMDADVSVDIAGCRVSTEGVGSLEEQVKAFVEFYKGLQEPWKGWLHDRIVLAHWRAQSYKWEQYVDIWDFFDVLEPEPEPENDDEEPRTMVSGPVPDDLRETCGNVKGAVEDMVERNDYAGMEFQHSHGLSVYFPWSRASFAKEYRSTEFAIRTGWDSFIDSILDGTRRAVRERPLQSDKDWVVDPETRVTISMQIRTFDGHDDQQEVMIVFSEKKSATAAANRSPFGPYERTTPPAGRTSVPAGRTTPPAGRTTPPAGRTTPPAGRVAQYVNAVLKAAPSTMKNPATGCDRVLRFRVKDWGRVASLGKTDELLKKLALLPISDKNRKTLEKTDLGKKFLEAVDTARTSLPA